MSIKNILKKWAVKIVAILIVLFLVFAGFIVLFY